MRFEGWRLAGGLAALSVAMAVLAVTMIAGAADEERVPRDEDPTTILLNQAFGSRSPITPSTPASIPRFDGDARRPSASLGRGG